MTATSPSLLDREAARQQALLAAVFHRSDAATLQPWLQDPPARSARGLSAYRATVQASAERALLQAFPTVAQLMSESSFAALARAYLLAWPPSRGDLAWLGEGLPTFIAASADLADEPYLADVARLDWALQRAESAADGPAAPDGLERLADTDPAALRVHFAPGAALITSAHPIATIWQAHQIPADQPDRFAAVRAAFAEGRAETAFVWRAGWRAEVTCLSAADAAFTESLLTGLTLAEALATSSANPAFGFQPWLLRAVQQSWLSHLAVTHVTLADS
jgi:hypothetical protein